jgi:hypothetical protein
MDHTGIDTTVITGLVLIELPIGSLVGVWESPAG